MGLRARHQPRNLLRHDEMLGRSGARQDVEVVRADGCYVHDARGRTFLDFQMGWCVGNLGWNPPAIMEAIRSYDGPSYVTPTARYAPWVELAAALVEVAPGRMRRAFRCTTGTEAVEQAIAIARAATGRYKLMALDGAYHGNSVAAKSLTGTIDHPLAGACQFAPPLDSAALDRLESMLKHRDIAAFIMEPIVLNLGVMIPERQFMRELVPLCHRFGTLVIADEAATGFGRTGALFACEHYDLAPDIICLAKAITSGTVPLGATLATASIAQEAEHRLDFQSTFGWHPIATEAALTTLDYWRQHRDEILGNVLARSSQLRERLPELRWPSSVDVRVRGLAVGVELETAAHARRIRDRCCEHGLLVFAEDSTLLMFPALTIDDATLGQGLEILQHCLA